MKSPTTFYGLSIRFSSKLLNILYAAFQRSLKSNMVLGKCDCISYWIYKHGVWQTVSGLCSDLIMMALIYYNIIISLS